jgi:hypothetical protein
MSSGVLDWGARFVKVGQGFHGILLGSQVFFSVLRCSWRRGE